MCVVVGVGAGTGASIARRFGKGYRVALVARNERNLQEFQKEIPRSKAYPCDVSDQTQFETVMAQIKAEMGPPHIAVYNAAKGSFKNFLELHPAVLNQNFQVNAMGLLYMAQCVAPDMVKAGTGVILVTGNTGAHRGVPHFAGFAPTKAAQRILAESIARTLGPQGIHVAYVTIDAVIDSPWQRKYHSEKPDAYFCQPEDIADECWHIAHQAPSAWSFNVELRPYGEKW